MDNDTNSRVKKSSKQYTPSGPPILSENATLSNEWQKICADSWKDYQDIYIDGMLTRRPNFDRMPWERKDYMRDIYINIHGWLAKAGAKAPK